MSGHAKPLTNIRLYDKKEHFNSILRAVNGSSHSTDLTIVCGLQEDVLVAVPAQAAALSSQSAFLLELLQSEAGREAGPVLLLPDVDIHSVQRLLQLLYTGV